jgi:hypothetical protein
MTLNVGDWADKLGGRNVLIGPLYDIIVTTTLVYNLAIDGSMHVHVYFTLELRMDFNPNPNPVCIKISSKKAWKIFMLS